MLRKYVIVILILISITVIHPLLTASTLDDCEAGGGTIGVGSGNRSYKGYTDGSGEKVPVRIKIVNFTIVNGSAVDFYIMKRSVYDNDYSTNQSFEIIYSNENTTHFSMDWMYPGTPDWVYVIDNRDNVRDSDAIPTGNVTYCIRIDVELYSEWEIPWERVVIASSIIIIMTLILITWTKRNQKF